MSLECSVKPLLPGIGSGPKEYLTTFPGVDTSETRGVPSLVGSCVCGHTHSYMQTLLGPDPGRTTCLFGYPRDTIFSSIPPITQVLFPKPHQASCTARLRASPVSCVSGGIPGKLTCDPGATQNPSLVLVLGCERGMPVPE